MRRTIVVALAVLAPVCFTYLYAHHIWNPLPTGTRIDRIVIEKSARKLSVLANGETLKSYRVALGRSRLLACVSEAARSRDKAAVHTALVLLGASQHLDNLWRLEAHLGQRANAARADERSTGSGSNGSTLGA